jgi:AraC family transcriptional regulator
MIEKVNLAQAEDWLLSKCVCSAGPRDRPFEEQHRWVALALVLEGTFEYRTTTGEAVLYPGSYLLGNERDCFECGHTHSVGDRCLALHLSPALVKEVSVSVAGCSRFRFRQPMLPARPELTSLAMSLQRLAKAHIPVAVDECVYGLVETVLATLRDRVPSPLRLAAIDVGRLSALLRHIDRHSSTAWSLEQLAAMARMSKYHFLRTFRRVTGMTPHRYLLATRLRRAVSSLTNTRLPISLIALNEGFNDLSTFNRYFRRMMNTTPHHYRATFGS